MGVTLERVQNKFACIIGELHREPIVLSQFAIWLDLRLAEYKANGLISLECTGTSPDPIWMKGHEILRTAVHQDQMIQQSSNETFHHDRGSPANTPINTSTTSYAVINSEGDDPCRIVVVKCEPEDFDLDGDNSCTQPDRWSNSFQHEFGDPSAIPTKATRFAVSSDAAQLGVGEGTTNARLSFSVSDDTMETEETEPVDFRADTTEINTNSSLWDNDDDEDIFNNSVALLSPFAEGNGENDIGSSSIFNSSENSPLGKTKLACSTKISKGDRILDDAEIADLISGSVSSLKQLYPDFYPARFTTDAIQKRCPAKFTCRRARKYFRETISCVAIVERWLWFKYADERYLENIPYTELDNYLCAFYPIIRKQNGERYTTSSLLGFRSHVEYFLRGHSYPHSITKSVMFKNSRRIFCQVKSSTTKRNKAIVC